MKKAPEYPWSIIVPVAIVLMASALRFVALSDLPPGLFFDESANGVDALAVLGGWHPVFFPGDQGREPLFIYLQAASMALIGPSPFALRLPAAFLGVATVAATYATFRVIAGAAVGAIGSGLLAASFWHVSLSRLAFRTDAMPLFTTLGAFFLWKGVRSGRLWSFAVGGACVGIGLYTYIPVRLAPVLFGAWLIGCFAIPAWRGKTTATTVALGSVVALVACTVIALPLGWYFYLHPHDFIERVQNAVGPAPSRTLFAGFVRALNGLFWLGDPNVRHDLPGRPLVELPVALLGVVGLVAGRRWRDGSGPLVLVWCIAMLVPAALTDEPAHALRLAGELPFVYFLPSVALASIARRPFGRYPYVSPGLVAAAVAISAVITARDYFVVWPAIPDVNRFFQADLLHSLGLVDQVPANSPIIATGVVYNGVGIPSAFVSEARTRSRAIDGQTTFLLPVHQDQPVYYIYARSNKPSGFLENLDGISVVATSADRYGRLDGELFRADPAFRLPAPSRAAAFRLGSTARIDGTDLVTKVQPGDYVPYALHWTVQGTAPPGSLEFFAHLVDRNGQQLLAQDYNRGFPPSEWRNGDQVISWFHLQVPANTPPGVADVDFGVIDPDSGQRIPISTMDGSPAGTALIAGPIRITGPSAPQRPPTHATNVRFGSSMNLIGYDLDPGNGGKATLQLHWAAGAPVDRDYTVFVHLLDASGKVIAGADSQPGSGLLPTSTWQQGETLLDSHQLAWSDAAPQPTGLEVGVYLLSTGERLPAADVDTGRSIGDTARLPW